MDTADRQEFLLSLSRARASVGFQVLAYCLMPNHFHLLLRVGNVPLPRIMQGLLTGYATRFNLRQGKTGHLFQSRYKAILCTDDSYLLTLVRYIHQNPVRAGFVADPSDWPWSSYRQYMSGAESHAQTGFPLSVIHERADHARSLLRDFTGGRPGEERCDAPSPRPGTPEEPTNSNTAQEEDSTATSFEKWAEAAAVELGESLDDLRGGKQDHALAGARREFALRALGNGFRAADVARFLNRTRSLITLYRRAAFTASAKD